MKTNPSTKSKGRANAGVIAGVAAALVLLLALILVALYISCHPTVSSPLYLTQVSLKWHLGFQHQIKDLSVIAFQRRKSYWPSLRFQKKRPGYTEVEREGQEKYCIVEAWPFWDFWSVELVCDLSDYLCLKINLNLTIWEGLCKKFCIWIWMCKFEISAYNPEDTHEDLVQRSAAWGPRATCASFWTLKWFPGQRILKYLSFFRSKGYSISIDLILMNYAKFIIVEVHLESKINYVKGFKSMLTSRIFYAPTRMHRFQIKICSVYLVRLKHTFKPKKSYLCLGKKGDGLPK